MTQCSAVQRIETQKNTETYNTLEMSECVQQVQANNSFSSTVMAVFNSHIATVNATIDHSTPKYTDWTMNMVSTE